MDANSDGIKDYLQKVPFITFQPVNQSICLTVTTSATFSVTATNTGGSYQWQVSTNGGTSWTNTGTNSTSLSLTAITAAMDLNQYRVLLTNTAYACSPLTSNVATLRAFATVPAQPGAITGNTTVCPSISLGYGITAMTQTLAYNWTLPAGWITNRGDG